MQCQLFTRQKYNTGRWDCVSLHFVLIIKKDKKTKQTTGQNKRRYEKKHSGFISSLLPEFPFCLGMSCAGIVCVCGANAVQVAISPVDTVEIEMTAAVGVIISFPRALQLRLLILSVEFPAEPH